MIRFANLRLFVLLAGISVLAMPADTTAQSGPHPNAHAHNDYEHQRPLFDALQQGFMSVEADIHLTDKGNLLVGHNGVNAGSPSLEQLYLRPLDSMIRVRGRIHPRSDVRFTLMIDLKTPGRETTEALKAVLKKYPSLQSEAGSVQIILSGNVPKDELLKAGIGHLQIDGRPSDIGKGIRPSQMPWISDRFSNWAETAGGKITGNGLRAIRLLADRVHAEGKLLRLWAIPDNETSWKELMDSGVDLINTDRLQALSEFLSRK